MLYTLYSMLYTLLYRPSALVVGAAACNLHHHHHHHHRPPPPSPVSIVIMVITQTDLLEQYHVYHTSMYVCRYSRYIHDNLVTVVRYEVSPLSIGTFHYSHSRNASRPRLHPSIVIWPCSRQPSPDGLEEREKKKDWPISSGPMRQQRYGNSTEYGTYISGKVGSVPYRGHM